MSRLGLYQVLQKRLVKPFLPRHIRSRDLSQGEFLDKSISVKQHKRIWLHAASVGELEALWQVADELSSMQKAEWILTVFSPSAEKSAQKLQSSFTRSR